MERRTGLVWHERYMWHEGGRIAGIVPAGYPVEPGSPHESVATKRRIKNLLDASGFIDQLFQVKPREATRTELLRVHTPAYLDRLEALNREAEGLAGLDGFMTRGSYDIARLSAGGALAAVDAIYAGAVTNAYALIRPVGHHAEADQGMGFCLLSNAALAAAHAMAAHGAARAALVDIDVHHGNGAQRIFWNDPRVLTISLHQDAWFPADCGALDERGGPDAFGTNINVPLPAGCGWGAYETTFQTVVMPALERFRPNFVIVPCGFDAGAQDPLGRMILHGGAFAAMTEMLLAFCERTIGGRLLFTHEGGYNPYTVPFMALAVLETLSGRQSGVTDPLGEVFANMKGHALLPHQAQLIAEAAAMVADVPGDRG